MSNQTLGVYFSSSNCAPDVVFRSVTSVSSEITHVAVAVFVLILTIVACFSIGPLCTTRVFKKARKSWLFWALFSGIGNSTIVSVLHDRYYMKSYKANECDILFASGECNVFNVLFLFTEMISNICYAMLAINASLSKFDITSSSMTKKTFSACMLIILIIITVISLIFGWSETMSGVYLSSCHLMPPSLEEKNPRYVWTIIILITALLSYGLKKEADSDKQLANWGTFYVPGKRTLLEKSRATRVMCFTILIYTASMLTVFMMLSSITFIVSSITFIPGLIFIYNQENIPAELLLFFPALPEGSVWANFFAAMYLGNKLRSIEKDRQKEKAESIQMKTISTAVRTNASRERREGLAKY
ncbi:unnamed protein product [Caenorhabditis brenneri]